MKALNRRDLNFRGSAALLVFIFIIVLISSFPLFWMFLNSVKPTAQIVSDPYKLLPSGVSFTNFSKLFVTTRFEDYFMNSLIVGIFVATLSVLAAFLAAYILTRISNPLNNLVTNLTLWTYMFPPILILLPLYILLHNVGLTDSLWGLVLVQVPICFSLSFWIAYPLLRDLPVEFEESAEVDGARFGRIIWHIVLPLLRPGIIAAGILSFVVSWNEYITARILVSGLRKTLPVGVQDIYESTILDWGMLMSASVLMVLPTFLIFLVAQKFFIDDWGAGGIKG